MRPFEQNKVRVSASLRHRRDSWPSHDAVGGLFFDFESLESVGAVGESPRHGVRAPRRRTRTRHRWDLAMRGIKTSQKHLSYAIDAVDKALWWGEEALRCHYRRHKASQLFSRQCDRKQDWLYEEAHYCSSLRSVMEDRLAKAPRTVAQRYYVSWLEDQLRRLKEQYVAFD